MAKTKSSKFQDSRTFTCSVPAMVVQPPGEYEYKVAIFNKWRWENSQYGSYGVASINAIMESNYPLFFYDGASYEGTPCITPCLYDTYYQSTNPMCMMAISKIVQYDGAGRGYPSPANGTVVAKYKSPAFRGTCGYSYGNWTTDCEGTYTLMGNGISVRRCITSFDRLKSGSPSSTAGFWDDLVVDLDDYPHLVSLPSVLFNGRIESGTYVEEASYYIGNLNNPTFETYTDWQAACREMERNNNG